MNLSLLRRLDKRPRPITSAKPEGKVIFFPRPGPWLAAISPSLSATMKMYILVRETIPVGNAILAAAHASLAAYLRFQEDASVKEWISGPFAKVICKVTDEEFEAAKGTENHVVLTESALERLEVAIAFKPRREWPKAFKFYRLYR